MLYIYIYIHILIYMGLILESKGIGMIFQKKGKDIYIYIIVTNGLIHIDIRRYMDI